MVNAIIKEGEKPVHGIYELSPDTKALSMLIVLSLATGGSVTFKNVGRSKLVDRSIELVSFMGANVDKDKRSVTVQCEQIKTHAVPATIKLPFSLRWLALIAALARDGKGGLEYTNLTQEEHQRLMLYKSNLALFGIKAEDDGDYLVFSFPDHRNNVYDIQNYTYVESISTMLFAFRNMEDGIVIKNIQWDYYSSLARDFLKLFGLVTNETAQNSIHMQVVRTQDISVEYEAPLSVMEGLLISMLVASNGGEVQILGVERNYWTPVLSLFNKIGLPYNHKNGRLRVWKAQESTVEEKLSLSTTLGLSLEFLSPVVATLARLNKEFEISERRWPGVYIVSDLKRLGIECIVEQEDAAIPTKVRVFGRFGGVNAHYDLSEFKDPVIPFMWALSDTRTVELSRFDVFREEFHRLAAHLGDLGIEVKVIDI